MLTLGANMLFLGSLAITWFWLVAEMVVTMIEYTAEHTSAMDCIAVLAFMWTVGAVLLVFTFAYDSAYDAYLGLVKSIE